MKESYGHDLVAKLTAGDFDGLKNPNVPISLTDMCKYDGSYKCKVNRGGGEDGQ